jgi:hypothetical protein
VGSDELDVANVKEVVDGDYQAILVSCDVEYDSTTLQYAGVAIEGLNVRGVFPLCVPSFFEPCPKRLFRVAVPVPKISKT